MEPNDNNNNNNNNNNNPLDSSFNNYQNVIVNNDSLTNLFMDMFNNPRFTGRSVRPFPQILHQLPHHPTDGLDRDHTEEESIEDDDDNIEDNETRRRRDAEQFINNLTNLILNPRTLQPRSGARNRLNQLLAMSFNQKPVYKKVLSEEGEQQLKKMLYKDSSKTNESCPIFYLDFEDNDEIIELPCKHIFTPSGIEKWLKEEKNECPVCRFELKSKEIKEVYKNVEEENVEEENVEEENDDENNNLQEEETPSLVESLRNAYNPTRSSLFTPLEPRQSIPHSYLDHILASEEQRQMEQAILASIRDLEGQQDDNETDDNLDDQSVD